MPVVGRGLALLAVLWSLGAARAQLLPASPSAPPPAPRSVSRPTFTWDVPRVLESVDVPGVMRADGIPIKLRSVKSAESAQVILQHLVDRFAQAGFYIPPDRDRTQWLREPQLTALDTERLISYTFVLQSNPDGTTTVVLGEANLGLAQREQQSSFAPVYPGATQPLRSEMEGALSMTYLVAAEPSKVRAFYVEQLRGAGYREDVDGTWVGHGEELRVAVRPARDGRTAVILLRRSAPDDGMAAAVRQGPQRLEAPAAPPAAPRP